MSFQVSQDGHEIMISRKRSHVYSLSVLPTKYHKYYIYLFNFVKVIRKKTPKVTHKTETANFHLMLCDECTCFEADFCDGIRASYRMDDEHLRLRGEDGDEFFILLDQLKVYSSNYSDIA